MKLKRENTAMLGMSVALFLASAGCGYHLAGRSDSLPKSIHVIAVPPLENKTSSYRIEQRLTTATVHEFLAKTSYRVVADPARGDAVLQGIARVIKQELRASDIVCRWGGEEFLVVLKGTPLSTTRTTTIAPPIEPTPLAPQPGPTR